MFGAALYYDEDEDCVVDPDSQARIPVALLSEGGSLELLPAHIREDINDAHARKTAAMLAANGGNSSSNSRNSNTGSPRGSSSPTSRNSNAHGSTYVIPPTSTTSSPSAPPGPSSTRYLVDYSHTQNEQLGGSSSGGYYYGGAYLDEPGSPVASSARSPSGSSGKKKKGNGVSELESELYQLRQRNPDFSTADNTHAATTSSASSGNRTSSRGSSGSKQGGGGMFSIFGMNSNSATTTGSNGSLPLDTADINPTFDDEAGLGHGTTTTTTTGAAATEEEDADWTLARALQAMEFDIAGDTVGRHLGDADFDEKEYRASSCKRQVLTLSTAICIIQIGFLVAMVQTDGYAPRSENPMIGPSAETMVKYGAKQAALIMYQNEWFRLVSPIALHAGVIHLISNVLIQLRVGGYLNLVFGNIAWLTIYVLSGIFGNLCSCIFLPDAVGVGSSGAVLGMLASWIAWIVIRWNKIPVECRGQRNCQLFIVIAAIAVTGLALGALFAAREVDDHRPYLRNTIRIVGFGSSVALFVLAFGYFIMRVHPSKTDMSWFEANDDWR